MTALTSDRNTPHREGFLFHLPVGAAVTIYAGAIVMKNATGYAVPGATATGQVCAGRAEDAVDNAAGSDGDLSVKVRSGVYLYDNAGDIDISHVGDTAYIVDDQTVSLDATGKSAAGKIVDVDAAGVWVRMGL